MKVGTIAENPAQWLALKAGYVPTPILETQASIILARAIQVAAQLHLFDELQTSPLLAEELAQRCGVHPGALQKLLSVLVQSGYLRQDQRGYRLSMITRKWLLGTSQHSLHDYIASRSISWDWLTHLEGFVRTGRPLQIHQEMTSHQWEQYQRGMRSLASISAATVARRTPVPKGARKMLDIGGAHGHYSVMLCRQHPDLSATILELPEAVQHAEPLLMQEGMGARVTYQAGDALTVDLGIENYDLVFISNLVHHFDAETNIDLFQRIARSLRPGGYLVVQGSIFSQDVTRQLGGIGDLFYSTEQLGSLWDLFFSLTSDAGSWAFRDIAAWQQQAGLIPWKPIRLSRMTGVGQQVAKKPAKYKASILSWVYEQLKPFSSVRLE